MVFLFATELEAQPFRLACPAAQIVICGVGAAECAATTAEVIASMHARGEEKRLVLCGIAGSYSLSDVALCEVVEVVSERIEALPERFQVCYTVAPYTALRAVSSNSVNSSAENLTHTSQIENMEGAAFMAVCQKFGVKHLQIRAISNRVGDPFPTWKIPEALNALARALTSLREVWTLPKRR